MCECKAENFRAETTPGQDHKRPLRVTGSCTCPMSGCRIHLEPGPTGIVPDPTQMLLMLRIEGGDAGADVITEIPVEPYEELVDETLATVAVKLLDGQVLTVPVEYVPD